MITQPLSARLTALLNDLTVDDKAALTSGSNMFTVRGIDRVGIPTRRETDGPNGARGTSVLGSREARAVCIRAVCAWRNVRPGVAERRVLHRALVWRTGDGKRARRRRYGRR